MRKLTGLIGLGTVLWVMAVFSPVWGQLPPPEGPPPGPEEAQEDLKGGFPPPGEGAAQGRRPAVTQGPGKSRENMSPRERREVMRKRVETIRMIRMTEELDLDEETAARLFSRLRPIEKKRWALIKERQEATRDLRKASNSPKPDSAKLKLLIDKLEENKSSIIGLEAKEQAVVKDLLNPGQQAKYMIFKERFNQEMKDRVQKARRGKKGPGPRSGMTGNGPGP